MDIFQFEHEDGTVTHGDMDLAEDSFELDEDLYIEADIPSFDTDDDEETVEEIDIGGFSSTKKVTARDFEIISVIGKGAYGKVFLVRKVSGVDKGELFAMKVLRKASLIVRNKDAEHTRAERTILERVQHPFIVNLMYAFQTDNKLYLIMEFASGGEVFTYMSQEGMFMEDTARFFLVELLLALEHIHSLGIIYRDLKPENILLDKDGHILLTDFGLSKVALDEVDGRAGTFCGTIEYMAPEMLAHHRYNQAIDWWSFGAVMYDMLSGQPPFTSSNKKTTMDKIMNGKLKLPAYFTPDAKDLVRKLLRKTPTARLGYKGADEIKAHPFFSKVDWDAVLSRQIKPPIQPILTGETDVSNFDQQFTSMPPVDSPADPVILSDSVREMFKGFSYMAPSVLLSSRFPMSPSHQFAPQSNPFIRGGALSTSSSPPIHMLSISPAGRHRIPRQHINDDNNHIVR